MEDKDKGQGGSGPTVDNKRPARNLTEAEIAPRREEHLRRLAGPAKVNRKV
ncbi:hypothetical protein LCGC14_2359810 [marine sediment metagenome]|uniref:Uncharacterized protein n=1 Tax=marine sediment metagenome TaxID=412755 RepID=A0A0F9EJE6_9ZZZZ